MFAALDGSDDGNSGTPLPRSSGEVRSIPGADRVILALDSLWNMIGDGERITAEDAVTRDAVVRVTNEARSAGLRPEELLTLLKSSWRSRIHAPRHSRDESEEHQLSRLVTLCIKSYFSENNAV